MPRWIIKFFPETPESETWNDIFKIRERYSRDVLDPGFMRWMEIFSKHFKRNNRENISENKLIEGLRDYIELLEIDDNRGPDFLQKPVFEMIYKNCTDGDERLIKQMLEMVAL